MTRLLALLLMLSACGIAPQKSLAPDLGVFETAFVETGRTEEAWSVAHIVRNDDQYQLVVYVRRADGRPPDISRMKSAGTMQRIRVGTAAGAMIPQTQDLMQRAAKTGFEASLCGTFTCYPVKVPATLYQQALLE
ncbi:MAG: hypothetical protein AAF724_23040 [Pseudomonadota bacterium]